MNAPTRITVTLPPDHGTAEADTMIGLLALHIAHGWKEDLLPTGEAQYVAHSSSSELCSEFISSVAALLPVAKVQAEAEEDVDWVRAWRHYFTPVRAGRHFIVLAPWMNKEAIEAGQEGRITIIIEPKNAFGTGHHATTALCLAALSDLFDQNVIRPGMRFLDLGAGSGILGLGLAKLGLRGDGLDIDVAAVQNALENRLVNNIDPDALNVRRGGVEEAKGPYDVIVANILAEPLTALAPAITAFKREDGGQPALILSGLLTIQAETVEAAYTALGRRPAQQVRDGEWAALVF